MPDASYFGVNQFYASQPGQQSQDSRYKWYLFHDLVNLFHFKSPYVFLLSINHVQDFFQSAVPFLAALVGIIVFALFLHFLG